MSWFILKRVKSIFVSAKGSHDWYHTERVLRLVVHIGEFEMVDMEIAKIATLLHDIGRADQDRINGKVCHAEIGGQKAKEILMEFNYDIEKIERVVHCIKSHRFRNSYKPNTIEAKVLFDADKLDSIGAVGIGRAFIFAGEVGAAMHIPNLKIQKGQSYTVEDTAYREFMVKLRKIKDKMFTTEGFRMAKERHKFMVDFFDRLNMESIGDI